MTRITPQTSISILKKGFSDGTVREFSAKVRGKIINGIVVRWNDCFFAYQNLCRHLPVTLDQRDGSFFNHEKTHLMCYRHGATYDVASGFCVAGPCEGASLYQLRIRETDDSVIVELPDELVS